jgi:hypothetical protein
MSDYVVQGARDQLIAACGINQGVVLMHYLTVLLMLALCCSVLYADNGQHSMLLAVM